MGRNPILWPWILVPFEFHCGSVQCNRSLLLQVTAVVLLLPDTLASEGAAGTSLQTWCAAVVLRILLGDGEKMGIFQVKVKSHGEE